MVQLYNCNSGPDESAQAKLNFSKYRIRGLEMP